MKLTLFIALFLVGCGQSFRDDSSLNVDEPLTSGPQEVKDTTSEKDSAEGLLPFPRFENKLVIGKQGQREAIISPTASTPYAVFRSTHSDLKDEILLARDIVGTFTDRWPEGIEQYYYHVGVYLTPNKFAGLYNWGPSGEEDLPDLGLDIDDYCDSLEKEAHSWDFEKL